ncbi:hypothetical protein ACEV8V_25890 [Vibrio parahaemolyticus]|uniref:hypothetical protein n=1 Tax=Vibrio parahaemolyticus TaxID=670 RepID=UPI000EFD4528|nr:hypothetical protein [Vibrio parahaemolyticus]AYO19643.1 hypothetical protein D0856_05640 [Vibrio owensii]WMN64989.1 hypothetical protein NI388_07650 [Vibrio parahaemolyticus]WMN75628.1 hypothetical protein NI386_15730 [Vibrio parahaemolyticus]HCG8728442.1 hypothetical protein [Vibrio parahaemolyticus]
MSGHNHYPDCTCGWCYKNNSGYKPPSSLVEKVVANIREQSRVFASYVNPSAYCPVCGASVFFYQSPNGGRVFFDSLGKPWEKHPCTDNSSRVVKTIPMRDFPTYERVGRFVSNQFNPFIIKSIVQFHATSRVKISGVFDSKLIVVALSDVTRHEFESLEIDVNSPCMMRKFGDSYILSFVNRKGQVTNMQGVISS